jgi:hypothetical protein
VEGLPWLVLAVFERVVGIATLGDAGAGDVTLGLVTAGFSVVIEAVSASTEELLGFWLALLLLFRGELELGLLVGLVLETTAASALPRPTT